MKDSKILWFLFHRLVKRYGENKDYDYMIHFKRIIEKIEKLEETWRSS